MLFVCSATPAISLHSRVSYQAGSKFSFPFHKPVNHEYVLEAKVSFARVCGMHTPSISFKANVTRSLYMHLAERSDESDSMDFANIPPHQKELDDFIHGLSNECLYNEPDQLIPSIKSVHRTYPTGEKLCFVENPSLSGQIEASPGKGLGHGPLDGLGSQSNIIGPSEDWYLELNSQHTTLLSESSTSGSLSIVDNASEPLYSRVPGSDNDGLLSQVKEEIGLFLSGITESLEASLDKANDSMKYSYDAISLLLSNKVKATTESYENFLSAALSSKDRAGELANDKLRGFAGELKGSLTKAGSLAIDVLRSGLVLVEKSIGEASSSILYYYESAKLLLPSQLKDLLNDSEERAVQVLKPVQTVLQQVYVGIEGLERYLGFDPSDPIVPFFVFLGSSATLVISYRFFIHGGYSGDLSPKSTLELLSNDQDVVLIDIRPEDLREKDGIPDIRRAARFRCASVTLPKIDASLKNVLKNTKEANDALLAAVIRNLKIVQDTSKVIVMDANGSSSKAVARSLRKLGVKSAFLVQGGFRSWLKDGLRIKENKPETALTILNEEAGAILEDIKPTPVKIVAYGVGLITVIYALLEWEKTLQFIGLIGLAQTIYWRVASYEDSEDLKQDLRLLASPVKIGAQAISWVALKLEPNRIGLATSPSSTAVQSRVIQAAAKHESQPADSEETTDPSESPTPASEKLDLSEA